MNHNLHLLPLILVLLLSQFFLSCAEEGIEPITTKELQPFIESYVSPSGHIADYLIDDRPVTRKEFAQKFEGGQIIAHARDRVAGQDANSYEIRVYHDLDKYFAYGRLKNYPLEESYNLDLEIQDYNLEIGIEAYVEANNKLPHGYEAHIAELQEKYLGEYLAKKRIPTKSVSILSEDCDGGIKLPATAQMPFMTTLNNEVSEIDRIAAFTWTHVYDKWFYGQKLFSYLGGGFADFPLLFCPNEPYFFANDRMSSAMFM